MSPKGSIRNAKLFCLLVVLILFMLPVKKLHAKDLVLSCSGTVTTSFLYFSRNGIFQNLEKVSKPDQYTLVIKNSVHDHIYSCSFNDSSIWCSSDDRPVDFTSVDRQTGRVSVKRFFVLDETQRIIREFDGICSKVGHRRF